jgi:crotonobetainyl-CoA:carnitine CoA-transferase CaiB-like acyl-CoA transferase
VALADSLGLDPVVHVGEGAAAIPMVRNPIDFSLTPARYLSPPPSLGQDAAEIREWLSRPDENQMSTPYDENESEFDL